MRALPSEVRILAVEGEDPEWREEEERRAFYHAFRDFLNALSHPVQILFRSQGFRVEDLLTPWRDHSVSRDENSAGPFGGYLDLLRGLAAERRILDRRLYLVVAGPGEDPRALSEITERLRTAFSTL